MKLTEFFLISILLIVGLTQTGCASMNRKLKAMLGGKPAAAEETKSVSTVTKFSESPDLTPRVRRQYKRTTKESLAQESSLDSNTGSLWVMEGQGAYLFSQNVVRLVGDPLAITLEGDPRDQLQSKVSVIRKLVAKIEERKSRIRSPASGDSAEDESKDGKESKGKDKKDKSAQAAQPPSQKETAPDTSDIGVKIVPTRIVERTLEGNYRIKGSQPFMISNREYKVIVTGIVRAEDFNEEGIPASKLLDSKFDIVSARRKEGEM